MRLTQCDNQRGDPHNTIHIRFRYLYPTPQIVRIPFQAGTVSPLDLLAQPSDSGRHSALPPTAGVRALCAIEGVA